MRYNADDIGWSPDQEAIDSEGEPITGEVVYYRPNGEIEAVVGYHEGFKAGIERWYHPGGTLEFEGEWTWSRGVGVHHKWYANGQLQEERLYDNGRLTSVLQWHEDGTPIEQS